jgi:hypothetical protein
MAKATRSSSRKKTAAQGVVAFDYQSATYQIDVSRSKVYQRWVEVDRIRQATVISAYRAAHVSA